MRAREQLERLNYVSTAYVAGVRKGVVYEHELALGQAFKNHYESTKFQAEVWVRDAMDEVPTTIYRPAIVVGDSRTGETQKFDGPYYMLRADLALRGARLPIPQFGRSAAPFNVVPVDFVVDALVAGSRAPTRVGETLHLVDPEPVTASELLTTAAREYAGREPSYRLPSALVERRCGSSPCAICSRAPRASRSAYLNHPVRFDTRRAERCSTQGLRCPRFDEYVGAMVPFFREHETDPSFKPAYAIPGNPRALSA